ncbi:hypothetical protein D9758_018046 [Tetrapyrgos nigripes]|uniref:Uncharacterized protein n=1 Tax=Tetrapyrgos nigripes TaxID=182062 RepID=A0A8H5B6K8_9AGAR|nr:hypothetical protein D9758_018046 [Tetrapyrgos nigripes]
MPPEAATQEPSVKTSSANSDERLSASIPTGTSLAHKLPPLLLKALKLAEDIQKRALVGRNRECFANLARTIDIVVSFAHDEVLKVLKSRQELEKVFEMHFEGLMQLTEAVATLMEVHQVRGSISATLWDRTDMNKAEKYEGWLKTWRTEFNADIIRLRMEIFKKLTHELIASKPEERTSDNAGNTAQYSPQLPENRGMTHTFEDANITGTTFNATAGGYNHEETTENNHTVNISEKVVYVHNYYARKPDDWAAYFEPQYLDICTDLRMDIRDPFRHLTPDSKDSSATSAIGTWFQHFLENYLAWSESAFARLYLPLADCAVQLIWFPAFATSSLEL